MTSADHLYVINEADGFEKHDEFANRLQLEINGGQFRCKRLVLERRGHIRPAARPPIFIWLENNAPGRFCCAPFKPQDGTFFTQIFLVIV